MIEATRRILGIKRSARVQVPDGKPTLVIHRHGEQWGVAMLHGGREIAFYEPDEARREAINLIRLADTASRPGELPAEACG